VIKVLICDDQSIVSTGLATILGSSPELEVVGTAGDGAEALKNQMTCIPILCSWI